jgi:hypothetical protein
MGAERVLMECDIVGAGASKRKTGSDVIARDPRTRVRNATSAFPTVSSIAEELDGRIARIEKRYFSRCTGIEKRTLRKSVGEGSGDGDNLFCFENNDA